MIKLFKKILRFFKKDYLLKNNKCYFVRTNSKKPITLTLPPIQKGQKIEIVNFSNQKLIVKSNEPIEII